MLRLTFLCCAVLPSLTLAADPSFVNRTQQAGINAIFATTTYENSHYAAGLAVGDFNRDGWQDLYIPMGGAAGLPDRFYVNNQDGTFTDRAAAWGLTAVHSAKGFAVGDYNDDGWVDLYVTSAGPPGDAAPCHHKLYRNNGGTSFTDVAVAAGVNCTTTTIEDGWGAAFGDYDLDGDLDLFVAGFASENSGSRLFRNDGDGTFTDVTAAIGFFAGTTISVSAFTPRFADMNGDFYPEMLLVGDFGTSRYFRNNTLGAFSDVTAFSNTSLEENGMGGTVGDFNGDLLLDWYVTSIYESSNGWTGNKMYLNLGHHDFDEVADDSGVDDGGYGWGVAAVDWNHDTFVDIAETNGGLGGGFGNEQSYLWMSLGDGSYQEQAIAAGLVHTGEGRGLVNLDYDNDGDQDLVIYGRLEFATLYENTLSGPNTNGVRIFLDTSAVPELAPGGVGSRVYVTAGIKKQMRYMSNGDNFLSQSELSTHFGLAVSDAIGLLEIEWPNGETTAIANIDANRPVTLMADGPVLCDPAPAEVENLTLALNAGASEISFTWDDTPGADSYRVFADSAPAGGFELVVVDAASGLTGPTAATPSGNKFFLVAGREDGCQGAK